MKNKEIKQAAFERLTNGENKHDVYAELVEQGAKPKKAAHYIASYPDPELARKHRWKIRGAMAVAIVQGLFAALAILGALGGESVQAALYGVAFVLCFQALFAWGFSRPSAFAFNAFILLNFISMVKSFAGAASMEVGSWIGLVIAFAMLAYVYYVRDLVFPDFAGISPRKKGSEYIFSSQPA